MVWFFVFRFEAIILFPIISMIGMTLLALNLGSDNGRIVLQKKIHLPEDFSLGKEEIALVYFGYIGCYYICLPALKEIQTLLENLTIKDNKNLAAYFISLQPEVDEV